MKKVYLLLALFAFLSTASSAQTISQWYTSMGTFQIVLHTDSIPITTGNFITLVQSNYYDGTIFHRVIDNFMNQGGDPTGTGTGGPGYTIQDEFHPDFLHDTAGILSMANTGQPNTGGSQFFITTVPTPWLDNAHSVFGKVIQGYSVVNDINEVATNAQDRPLTDVVIDSIRILPTPPPVGLSEKKLTQATLKAYPNPSNESVTLEMNLANAGEVSLSIFNGNGQLVDQLLQGNHANGTIRVSWNRKSHSSNLDAGLYFYQWITPDGVFRGPLVLMD